MRNQSSAESTMNYSELQKSPLRLADRSTSQVIVEAGLALVILLTAALGNFLMMLVMYRKKQLLTIPNIFVLNLTIGNFLLASTVLPVFFWTLATGEWKFGSTFCEIQGYQNYVFFAVTLFTLTGISVNRYILICFPNKYRGIFDKKVVLKMVCSIWILCVISCGAPLFGWGHFAFNPRTALCHTDNSSASFKITANAFMLLDIFIVVYSNVKIAKAVKVHRKRIAVKVKSVKKISTCKSSQDLRDTNGNANQLHAETKSRTGTLQSLGFPQLHDWLKPREQLPSENKSGIVSARIIYISQNLQDSRGVNKERNGEMQIPKESQPSHVISFSNFTEQKPDDNLHTKELRGDEIRITRTITIIVFVFCVCWLPCFVMDSMDAAGVFPPRNLRMAGIYLIFLDSVLGPVLYGIRSRKIRQAFFEVLRCS